MRFRFAAFFAFACLASAVGGAERVSVAAAANLVYALESLSAEFKRAAPDIELTTTAGASGSLFTEIKNGAPFDVFMSADTVYPRRLVEAGLGEASTVRVFAEGRLVFWTTRPNIEVIQIPDAVRSEELKTLAIAQPKVAPYGRAARAALEKLGVWAAGESKAVYGEDVTQTAQLIETGRADAGFVALSLVVSARVAQLGRWTEVPTELYHDVPLDHALVLTRHGRSNPAARKFLEFMASPAAKEILNNFGYRVP